MATQSSEFGAEADAVIERLDKVAPSRPLDRGRAESALADHLRALSLDPKPVRWIQSESPDQLASAREGFIAAWATLWSRQKGRPAVGMTSTATFKPLYGKGLRKGGLIGEAEKEEKGAGRGTKRAARKAEKAVGKLLEGPVNRASRHGELERVVEDALGDVGMHRQTTMIQAIG